MPTDHLVALSTGMQYNHLALFTASSWKTRGLPCALTCVSFYVLMSRRVSEAMCAAYKTPYLATSLKTLGWHALIGYNPKLQILPRVGTWKTCMPHSHQISRRDWATVNRQWEIYLWACPSICRECYCASTASCCMHSLSLFALFTMYTGSSN
jgi:hypothetical protein